MRNLRKFLLGKHGGGDVTEHLGVDGKIILKWVLRSRLGVRIGVGGGNTIMDVVISWKVRCLL
jgi:hypothetical protein